VYAFVALFSNLFLVCLWQAGGLSAGAKAAAGIGGAFAGVALLAAGIWCFLRRRRYAYRYNRSFEDSLNPFGQTVQLNPYSSSIN
jgi:hypothetical protein